MINIGIHSDLGRLKGVFFWEVDGQVHRSVLFDGEDKASTCKVIFLDMQGDVGVRLSLKLCDIV